MPAQAAGGGLGLHTMRDRVTELGGGLVIDSAPGAGTRVRAWFPLRPAGPVVPSTAAASTAAASTAAAEIMKEAQ